MELVQHACKQHEYIKSEMLKGLTSTSVWTNFSTSNWFTIRQFCSFKIICRAVQRSENKLKIRDCQRHLEDHLKNFNIQTTCRSKKYFTIALLVLLVTNIMSEWWIPNQFYTYPCHVTFVTLLFFWLIIILI